ncbi:MAG: carbon-nitrogen hydrolase family protein [Christensenellaceae bacterium]|jgi:predicted amidohydrolase
MRDKLTIGVVNMQARAGQTTENVEKMCAFVEEAAKKNVEMLLFPELCMQGYDFFVDARISFAEKHKKGETLAGESCTRLSNLAVQHQMYITFGMAERTEEKLYNAAVTVTPDGAKERYRKIHPFDAENTAFAKGEQPCLINTPFGPVGIGICYDTYQFPELMRYYTYHGARLYLNPTAVVEEREKEGSKKAFLRYYKPTLEYGVLANTIYVASANLTKEDTINYFGGGSVVIGPAKTDFFETDVQVYAGDYESAKEGVFVAEIDLSLATRRIFTENKFSNEADYRPQLYQTWWENKKEG